MAERSGGERKASAGRQGPRVAHKWPRQVACPVPPFPGAARAGSKLPARGGPGSCRELGVRAWERRKDDEIARKGPERETQRDVKLRSQKEHPRPGETPAEVAERPEKTIREMESLRSAQGQAKMKN